MSSLEGQERPLRALKGKHERPAVLLLTAGRLLFISVRKQCMQLRATCHARRDAGHKSFRVV